MHMQGKSKSNQMQSDCYFHIVVLVLHYWLNFFVINK